MPRSPIRAKPWTPRRKLDDTDLILLRLLYRSLTDKEHVDLAKLVGVSRPVVHRRRRQHVADGLVLYDGERYRLNPTAYVDSLPDNVHFFQVFSTRPGAFVPLAGMPITPSLFIYTLGSGKPGLPFYRKMVQQEWSRSWGLFPEDAQMLDGIGRPLPPDEWLMKSVDDCVRTYLSCLLEILGQTVEANNLDVVREITDVTLDSAKATCASIINAVYNFRKKLSLSDLNGQPVSYKIGYMGKARMKESYERYKTK